MAKQLTKKEKGFANKWMDTGNGTLAAKESYNVSTDNSAAVIAHRELRKAKIQEYIANHAEDAEAMIYKLSQNAKAEFVRLGASKDIMDRAGFKPVERTQNTNLNIDIESDEIMDNLTAKLNEIYKGTSEPSNGGIASSMDTKTQDKE